MDVLAILNWLFENWQAIALLVPTLGLAVTSILGKLGRIGVIVVALAAALRDHVLTDAEAAMFVWMIAAVAFGLWFNVSTWVLDYAPDHQIAMLKAKKFIPDKYRPQVLAALPTGA